MRPLLLVRCVPFVFAASLTAQFEALSGTVTDPAGAPAAGVTIEVSWRETEGFSCLDLPASRAMRQVQSLRTGKNGSFALQLPRGVPFHLFVDDGVHAPIRMRTVYAGEDLALRLVPAARVSLTLRDEAGAPCPGRLEAWDLQHVRWVDDAIDAQGRWTSGRLQPGSLTLDIAPATARRPEWHKLTLVAGETTPVELSLAAGCVLSGRVTDATTRKPLVGARIGEGWTMDKFVVTDADGRYEMRGYGGEGYGEARVTAEGYGPQLRRLKSAAGGLTADFALEPACEVTGRIVDAAGKPVVHAYVAAVGGEFGSGDGDTHDWCSAHTDASGRYRLRGVRRAIDHSLLVHAEGTALLIGDMQHLTGPLQLPDVVTRAARYVSGVVVDADGAPQVGIDVRLRGTNADRNTLLGAGAGADAGCTGADYLIASRSMKTDSRGRIHFANVAAGTYQLEIGGRDTQEAQTIEVAADKDPEPLRVTH
jgi:hypothetical protein